MSAGHDVPDYVFDNYHGMRLFGDARLARDYNPLLPAQGRRRAHLLNLQVEAEAVTICAEY